LAKNQYRQVYRKPALRMVKIKKLQKDLLSFKKIGLDSMVFIYQFSDHPQYGQLTNVVMELLGKKKIKAVTSAITIIEAFVKPEKESDLAILNEYENVFQHLPSLEILPIDWPLSRLTARLRAQYPTIRIPDAVQISAALFKECSAFLTNDNKLKKVKEIKVITLKDYL